MSLRTVFIRSSLCLQKIERVKAGSNLEFVRFRKPRFEPKAESKVFRVREQQPVDKEEYKLMQDWTRRYNTEIKSLRSYLVDYSTKIGTTQTMKPKRLDVKEVEEKNNLFNSQSRNIREAAMQELHKTQKLKNEKLVLRDIREREEMKRKAQERVTREQERFADYILPENMDDKLERVLNTRKDPNHSITKFGKISQKQTGDKDSHDAEEILDDSTKS